MDYVLDILQGAGLALACGLRPFLPALLAGALASADLGLDFEGTAFAFLEEGWFLLAVSCRARGHRSLRARLEQRTREALLSGVGIGFGALLCAASLDDRSDVWWPGLLVGAACAALAAEATRDSSLRTRRRLDAARPPPRCRSTRPASPCSLAGLSIAGPPLALLALGFFGRLVAGGRREGEKYAGLRILR